MRTTTTVLPAFRFDRRTHTYYDAAGSARPHITGMLLQAGLIDDTWYTEESCERGTAVHQLTADYDLGALTLDGCDSDYRGWLLGHVEAMRRLQPQWAGIETPCMHPQQRWGGRPDRDGHVWSLRTVLEVKSGVPSKSHMVQTALQALLLASQETGVPAESWQRLCLYLTGNGRFKLDHHKNPGDFAEARRIIKLCC